MANPIVAIVGRPNVGKSALLNRLISSRDAIVEETPGVTRDRIYRDCTWNGRNFTLVDTGGILIQDTDNLKTQIRLQVEVALAEAELILFVVDVREGVNPMDQDVVDLLRRTGKKVLVVANKADNLDFTRDAAEFYSFGLGEPLAVSSVHGLGSGDLLDSIIMNLPEAGPDEVETEPINVCIVGRPNVGKSSLLNAISGEERSIVTNEPGTTRDAIDLRFNWGDRDFVIMDTAGLRRRGKIEDQIEYYSTTRARQAIDRSSVGLLILDATEPAVMQDKRIAGILDDAGKGLIIVINKWDLIEPGFRGNQNSELMTKFLEDIRRELDFMSYAPVIFISALTKAGIKKILPKVVKVHFECTRRVETPVVNKIFQNAFFSKPPPSYKGESLKLLYAFQAKSSPPVFIMKVNNPKLVHFSYKRYLENQFRKALGFNGTPIRLVFKK